MNKYIIPAVIIALVACVSLFVSGKDYVAFGSATPGLPSVQQMATTTQVGPQENKTLFTRKDSCTSRVVRTQGQDIYILFAEGVGGDIASSTLSGSVGFTQAASTTVAYDSGIFGCGRMTAEAVASTTITIAEFF